MKKIFGFGSKKGESPLGSSISPGRDGGQRSSFQCGYRIRDKDLGKIHKAAIVGNVAKVQQILLLGKNGLNDRDKMNRTALHLACANGHPAVVTLLLERKCLLNLCDDEHRTALMKAVECQEEECATLLLAHGADPNVRDVLGNTALHYAVFCQNISLAAKLLSYDADIEARNKDDLTPLSLAISERKQQMVEFLAKKEANIHAGDKMKSIRQLISEYEEERPKTPPENSNPEDESSEEDSLSRFSNKPGVDSWPTSDDEDLDLETKNVLKPNLTKLMNASQQSKRNIAEAKCGTVRPESPTSSEDSNSDSEIEDVLETTPEPSPGVQGFPHPAFPSPEPLAQPVKSLAGLGLTEEGATKPENVEKESDTDIIERAPQEQINLDHLSSVDGTHKNNRSDMMSALGLGEEEDIESPWDSESISESLPRKYVDLLSGAAGQRGKNTLNGQVEDVSYIPSCMIGSRNFKMAKLEEPRHVGIPVVHMDSPEKYPNVKPTVLVKDSVPNKTVGMKDLQTSTSDLSAELDLEMTSEEEEEKPIGDENNYSQVEEEKKQHKSSEVEVSDNVCDTADESGLIQQRKSGGNSNQEFAVMENEGSDSSDPGVHRKEIKKKHSGKWTQEECVIAPIFEKTDSLTGGLLHVNDDSILSEVDQDDDRPAKKTSNENNKVKEQINSVDDLDDLTQSSETASEDGELLYCKNSMLLIEQLDTGCKDSVSLLKIRDTILSYERLVELKKSHCELLRGKIKKMESKVSGLQKELSETKEVKSQLEHQKVEWEQELGSLRFTLKQEEEQRRNADMLYEKIREQLRRKEDQYSKEVEMKQQLELTVRALEMELKTVRNDLHQVIEERDDTQKQLTQERNARILQDGILANHLAKQKEIEMANKEMNSEVSDSCEEAKDLLHKNHMLHDEIAMLRLEIDAVKNQNQEKEKKYFEDIEIVKGKNDDLQKAIKLNEETLTQTIFQYTGQLNALTAENTMLNSKLENEKESKQRLETEVESYRSRLAAAIHDYDQCQTSKRDLELAFQRARDEWLHLQDKMNFDVSNLKENNEMLSQQLSRAESKFNNLEIKLHHTRDALREKILMLERVQRDLSQAECQKQEIEHMYQNEQGKVNKYIGKQESLEERLSQLQSENMLLRQQLDDSQNKADSKEKTVISIQDQFQQIVRKLQAESEKQGLMLEERNKELINECNHLKERMYQYENEKAEREAVVRQLQQELADTLKKQSMSEASLEVLSRYRANLEVEAQDLKKKLCQLTSQLEEAQDQLTEAVRCAEKTQDHVQKLEIENAELQTTVKKQAGKIEQLEKNLLSTRSSEDEKEQLKKYIELKQSLEDRLDQEKKKNSELEKEITGFKKVLKMTRRKLNEYENGELSFHGDLKTSQTEMDIQINMLKHKIDDLTAELETASSKCLHLDAKNQVLREELLSIKGMQKKCEKLEKNKKKLEQEVVNLRSLIEMNMIEHSQIEQYKREIEERARQELVEKLKEVNLFLQIQAASQENLEQLQEKNNASIRSQMELRIKDLEYELSKVKTLQEDSHKAELEKYKHLYLVEIAVRKSLEGKLDKTHERLAEINTKLEVEKQQNRSLLSTLSTRPVLEPPCVGNFNNPLVLHESLTPRANGGFSTSIPRRSDDSMETYLTKMRQELDRSITRELREAAAEFESESYGLSPLGATDGSNLYEDLLLKTSQEYVQGTVKSQGGGEVCSESLGSAMKKIFGFGSKKGVSPFGSSINPVRDSSDRINFQPGYHIQDKDLRKIHKAAIVGNVAKVQQVLFFGKNGLNDRDKMNRTALHLACANGHPAVVALLLERKCLLNLCDNENRTALMKAVECQEEECATLLLAHGADPNVRDVRGNTALHCAVFCQNISLAAKLLSYDADIEARNKCDLTPLLLGISERREQIVEFLVNKGANIHAVDNLKRTALMLAVNNGSANIVRLLLQQGADIFPQDVFGWTAEEYAVIGGFNIIRQLISKYKEERPKTPPESSNPENESSKEDSLSRFSSKPGADLRLTSDNDVLDLETKQSISESLPQKYVDCLSGAAGRRGKKTLNGQVEDSPEKYVNVKPAVLVEDSVPNITVGMKDFQTSSSDWSSTTLSLSNETCQRAGHLKVDDQCLLMSQSMTKNQSTSTEFGQMTITDTVKTNIAAVFLVGNSMLHDLCQSQVPENRESEQGLSAELDLEMISEEEQEKLDGIGNNHSQVEGEQKHQSREVEVPDNEYDAADESGLKSGRNSNQECTAMENEHFDSSDPGVHRKKVKEKNNDKQTPEDCVIAPVFEKANSLTGGLLLVNDDNKVDEDDDRLFLLDDKDLNDYNHASCTKTALTHIVCSKGGRQMHEETAEWLNEPARIPPYEKKKVKEQIDYVNHLDDLPQLSENVSEDGDVLYSTNSMLQVEPLGLGCKDSVSLLKIRDTILSYERLVAVNKSHCELLRGKIKKMESKVSGLQKELSETKEAKSQLEHQKVDWEREFSRLRFTLKQEEENRRNANMLYEKMRAQLRRKEDEYSKEVGVTQRLALTLRALEMKLKTERSHLSQVSDSCEDTKALLLKNHMLQDEIAMLRLEIDAMKNQHRAKEENYFEDIEILKVKNDNLQKEVKLTEETLTQTISHCTGQLNALTAENTVLNSKLENKKDSKQRLETEVKSYRSRLAAALHDHDQGQTSKRDMELAFQRAKEEWLCLQDKMESDVAHLKENNEMLSQQLSAAESEFNKLKTKLHHTRDDLREKTLTLERAQRDLSQAECQKQEIEHMYQNEQGKVSKYIRKQESLEERLSQLQSENMLLRQQLDDAQKRADSKEKTVISIQDQFQQIVRKLQAEREKQGLMLEERNEELINKCNHLRERMHQYKNEKAEGEAPVRQLRQELDDTVKTLSMSDASLKGMSWCRAILEAEAQDLKNKFKLQLCQLTSQTQAGSQQMDLRIKDLESEVLKMKTLQEDSNKAGLEKYKQLYLEECEVRKALEDKLDKTHERLAEINTKLEVEKQQNRSLLSTLSSMPVLEPPCVGNFNNPLVLHESLTPRANVGFSTSIPRRSDDSMETYLTKMRRELDRSIARGIREADAQFASDAFRLSSRGSADESDVCDDLLL